MMAGRMVNASKIYDGNQLEQLMREMGPFRSDAGYGTSMESSEALLKEHNAHIEEFKAKIQSHNDMRRVDEDSVSAAPLNVMDRISLRAKEIKSRYEVVHGAALIHRRHLQDSCKGYHLLHKMAEMSSWITEKENLMGDISKDPEQVEEMQKKLNHFREELRSKKRTVREMLTLASRLIRIRTTEVANTIQEQIEERRIVRPRLAEMQTPAHRPTGIRTDVAERIQEQIATLNTRWARLEKKSVRFQSEIQRHRRSQSPASQSPARGAEVRRKRGRDASPEAFPLKKRRLGSRERRHGSTAPPSCHLPETPMDTSAPSCHLPETPMDTSAPSCHLPETPMDTSAPSCHLLETPTDTPAPTGKHQHFFAGNQTRQPPEQSPQQPPRRPQAKPPLMVRRLALHVNPPRFQLDHRPIRRTRSGRLTREPLRFTP